MDNFGNSIPISAFVCLGGKAGLHNARWPTGRKSVPHRLHGRHPTDHFDSFAIPFAAIQVGDGGDAIYDIQKRLQMQAAGQGGEPETKKRFGKAMHAVNSFFHDWDAICASMKRLVNPKLLLNSIGQKVRDLLSLTTDGPSLKSALSCTESANNEDCPYSEITYSDQQESTSVDSPTSIIAPISSEQSLEQWRPRYLSPPEQGNHLTTKGPDSAGGFKNCTLRELDYMFIVSALLVYRLAASGIHKNVALTIGVCVMCVSAIRAVLDFFKERDDDEWLI